MRECAFVCGMYTWGCGFEQCASLVIHVFILMSIVFECYLVFLWNITWDCELEQSESLVNYACLLNVYSRLFKAWCVYVGIYTGESGLVECASLVNHVCILISIVV